MIISCSGICYRAFPLKIVKEKSFNFVIYLFEINRKCCKCLNDSISKVSFVHFLARPLTTKSRTFFVSKIKALNFHKISNQLTNFTFQVSKQNLLRNMDTRTTGHHRQRERQVHMTKKLVKNTNTITLLLNLTKHL